jgi:hypothetical protein
VTPSVPAGPLAVRWLGKEIPPQRAGARTTVTVEVENAGSVAWRGEPGRGIQISYHWLDLRRNPIVWASAFTPLLDPVAPGERATLRFPVDAPIPPGRYRLAIDLLDEPRAWFAELGNEPNELEIDVAPRVTGRALAVRVAEGSPELVAETEAALAAQEEPIVDADAEATAFLTPGAKPAVDWSRRVLDAHAEGYAVVAGSVAVEGSRFRRGAARELEPWKPGFGRSPGWSLPLIFPSIVSDALEGAPLTEPVCGLPALEPSGLTEPWLCDGRIRVAVAVRALQRGDRRSA